MISGKPGYENLNAVKSKHVYVADGNQYFNRPGPRLVESLEMMAEMIYPESFDYGHKGTGWIEFSCP
jgi:iron complex transport system substrate-binding protein